MELQKALNIQVANWSVLYTKLHNYHWYVKGSSFFILHGKFEELYDEAGNIVDEIAERLLALGGKPAATMKEYLEIATLNEAGNEATAKEMVAALVADYKTLKEELVQIEAATNDDSVTNDLAVGLIGKIDTHVWMLTAYIED